MNHFIGRFVVIRTFSSGVHCGYLEEINGTACVLRESRNIHRWAGAVTVNELSQDGPDREYTRVSKPVPLSLFTETINVIPCSEHAEANLKQSRWPEGD